MCERSCAVPPGVPRLAELRSDGLEAAVPTSLRACPRPSVTTLAVFSVSWRLTSEPSMYDGYCGRSGGVLCCGWWCDPGVAFSSDSVGYICGGSNGVGPQILKTTDGGMSWNPLNVNFGLDVLLLDLDAVEDVRGVIGVWGCACPCVGGRHFFLLPTRTPAVLFADVVPWGFTRAQASRVCVSGVCVLVWRSSRSLCRPWSCRACSASCTLTTPAQRGASLWVAAPPSPCASWAPPATAARSSASLDSTVLLARRVRGRGPRGLLTAAAAVTRFYFFIFLACVRCFAGCPGAGVSVDGGKTFTVYDTKLTCDARYGAFPSDSVWYVAAGK